MNDGEQFRYQWSRDESMGDLGISRDIIKSHSISPKAQGERKKGKRKTNESKTLSLSTKKKIGGSHSTATSPMSKNVLLILNVSCSPHTHQSYSSSYPSSYRQVAILRYSRTGSSSFRDTSGQATIWVWSENIVRCRVCRSHWPLNYVQPVRPFDPFPEFKPTGLEICFAS